MSREGEVRGGTCRTCGRDLVQTPTVTYHPSMAMPLDAPCPDLLPIPGTEHRSFDVPPENFIPDGTR